jgi:hypothetical protein
MPKIISSSSKHGRISNKYVYAICFHLNCSNTHIWILNKQYAFKLYEFSDISEMTNAAIIF